MRGVGARRGASVHTSRSARELSSTQSNHTEAAYEHRLAPSAPAMRVNPAKGCKEVDVGAAAHSVSRFKTPRASVKGDRDAAAAIQLWPRSKAVDAHATAEEWRIG